MPEQAAFGPLLREVPGRAHERVKVIEPVLVKLVAAAPYLPVQAIVQHLRRHCTHAHATSQRCAATHFAFIDLQLATAEGARGQHTLWQGVVVLLDNSTVPLKHNHVVQGRTGKEKRGPNVV